MRRVLVSGCAVAVAVVLGITGTGCDGTPGGSAGREGPLTAVEHRTIQRAQVLLIDECMNREGFSYPQSEVLTAEENRPVEYVQDDVAWARKHGYGSRIAAKAERARAADPVGTYRAELSPERRAVFDLVLGGGPDAPVLTAVMPDGSTVSKRSGGCVGESERELYGDPARWYQTDKAAANLKTLYLDELQQDPLFTAARDAWSACMAEEGHRFADPAEAQAAVAGQPEDRAEPERFRYEREIAVADGACARATELRAVGRDREAHYISLRDAENLRALAQLHQLETRALARAVETLERRT